MPHNFNVKFKERIACSTWHCCVSYKKPCVCMYSLLLFFALARLNPALFNRLFMPQLIHVHVSPFLCVTK